MFEQVKEALDWLYAQKKLKKREDLSRIKYCLELLNIQKSYKIIHIAGTNGKGSTACFLKNMLIKLGYKVGFFVSPYVLCFNERIQINHDFITDERILFYCNQLYKLATNYYTEYQDTIPFFELTYLMALLYFQEMQIDYAVIECGIGGRLDATNALDSDIAVITNIGYDHMAQLGNHLEEIALHKLGITRTNRPCFTAVDSSLKELFLQYAAKNSVDMHFIVDEVKNIEAKETLSFTFKKVQYETSMEAYYQAYNASLAIAVILYLFPNYPTNLLKDVVFTTSWPGRFEFVRENVILDGAHNIDGILALVKSIQLRFPFKKVKVVFTALHDKEIKTMLHTLDLIADCYCFTTIEDKRATEVSYFEQFTKKPYQLVSNYKDAINSSFKDLKDNEILLITGSLHFISLARVLFK